MTALINQAAEITAFGSYLRDSALRTPVGRLLTAIQKAGSEPRIAALAAELALPDRDFSAAVAEAEHGGLVTREIRDGKVHVLLTSQGQARLEAMTRA